jgi:vacuolar-type H+-ATPase subunit H
MEDEQSLLEQVRQKEGELKKKFEAIHDLNEKKIADAKKKAAETIDNAECESDEETKHFFDEQRLEMQKEIEGLKKLNNARKTEIIARGEENQQKAVRRIASLVSMKEEYAAEND